MQKNTAHDLERDTSIHKPLPPLPPPSARFPTVVEIPHTYQRPLHFLRLRLLFRVGIRLEVAYQVSRGRTLVIQSSRLGVEIDALPVVFGDGHLQTKNMIAPVVERGVSKSNVILKSPYLIECRVPASRRRKNTAPSRKIRYRRRRTFSRAFLDAAGGERTDDGAGAAAGVATARQYHNT